MSAKQPSSTWQSLKLWTSRQFGCVQVTRPPTRFILICLSYFRSCVTNYTVREEDDQDDDDDKVDAQRGRGKETKRTTTQPPKKTSQPTTSLPPANLTFGRYHHCGWHSMQIILLFLPSRRRRHSLHRRLLCQHCAVGAVSLVSIKICPTLPSLCVCACLVSRGRQAQCRGEAGCAEREERTLTSLLITSD